MAYIDNVYSVVQIQPNGVETFVRLSQNENGRKLYFAITGGEIPSGSTVTISGTKPDGVVYSATGTMSENVALINEDIQLTAVAGSWRAKLRILNGEQVVATGNIRFVIDPDTVAPGSVPSDSQLEGLVAEAAWYAQNAKSDAYGSPLVANTVAGMTDTSRVYVYTGTESGYTNGNWYYYDGSAWVSGGVYNAQGVDTDTTLTRPGVAADAKATGDELTALKEDLENLEPGLSDEAKAALLTCFRHVVWTDGESQTYYDELEAALNDSGRTLESIRAAYISAGHTVYPWDTLDSLKPYLTVTAVYSDASETIVSEYDLSGNLSTATSVITVGYAGKTAQVNVNVTIDSALLYYLPTGTVLDGTTSGGFDTGIKLSDTNKAISVIIDTTDEEILTRVRALQLISDWNASTRAQSWQFGFAGAQSGDTYTKQYYTIAVSISTSQKSSAVANTAHRVKIAVIHPSNTNTYTLFMSIDGVVMYDFTSQTGSFAANDQTAFIGKRPDNQYPWKGTLTTCAIFGRALSTTEAKELLGVN